MRLSSGSCQESCAESAKSRVGTNRWLRIRSKSSCIHNSERNDMTVIQYFQFKGACAMPFHRTQEE